MIDFTFAITSAVTWKVCRKVADNKNSSDRFPRLVKGNRYTLHDMTYHIPESIMQTETF